MRRAKRVCGVILAACLFLGGLPMPAAAQQAPPDVGAEAYVVMDAATGQVLVGQNSAEARFPASITKIMTLALALENIDIATEGEQRVTVSQQAVDALIPNASMVALISGEEVSVNDLLYATQIESANDAANVLGEYIAGSMDGFVQMMNEKVRQLGLHDTHFMNPSGQPDDDHYTTAYDMAVITRWALSVPGFREIFGALSYTMQPTNRQPAGRSFNNSNLMLTQYSSYHYDGVVGSKTGYTDDARYTLATAVHRGDTELICIVLNNQFNEQKYTSTIQLLDYCFDNFERVSYNVDGGAAAAVPVYNAEQEMLGEVRVESGATVELMLHSSVTIDAVSQQLYMPERYVVDGDTVPPSVVLSLPLGHTAAQNELLRVAPLSWSGLEEIVQAQAPIGVPVRERVELPPWFWPVVLVSAALVGMILARIIHVRHRREKRRMQRLRAVQAQRPISIAARPPPPVRSAQGYDRRRSAQAGALRTATSGGPAAAPRRAGRTR